MVREAERRKRKYEKNIDGDQVGRAFKAQKDIMVDQEKTYFPQIAQVERKVKKLCEAQGIATYLIAQYINYARECYSKAERFTQDTLTNELQYLANKWTSRGLLGAKLQEIAKFFGVDITAVAAAVGAAFFGFWRYRQSAAQTLYYGLNDSTPLAIEAQAQAAIWKGRFTALKVYVDTNNLNGTASVALRVNGAGTLLVCAFGVGETGLKTTEAVVEVNENDMVVIRVITLGVAGAMFFHPCLRFEATE